MKNNTYKTTTTYTRPNNNNYTQDSLKLATINTRQIRIQRVQKISFLLVIIQTGEALVRVMTPFFQRVPSFSCRLGVSDIVFASFFSL